MDYVLGYTSTNDVSSRVSYLDVNMSCKMLNILAGLAIRAESVVLLKGLAWFSISASDLPLIICIGFDKASPAGPCIVSPKAIPDPSKLKLRGLLNGNVVQESGLECVAWPWNLSIANICLQRPHLQHSTIDRFPFARHNSKSWYLDPNWHSWRNW